MTILRIVKLGTSSLRNHIVFVFVFVSLPTAAVFAVSSYQDNELTPVWMLRIFVASTLGGLFVALVGWFVILPPILRRSGRKHD
jgi:cytochrome bd-type quinol oxidase subunit 1